MTQDLSASRQRVLDEIRGHMAQLDLAPGDVDPAATLIDDLDFDSLDWLDLVLCLEEDLQIALHEQKLVSVRTVEDVVDCVLTALAERPPGASPGVTPPGD
jgi:acyl carrier protein